MFTEEFDYDRAMEISKEEAREEGLAEGEARGRAEGRVEGKAEGKVEGIMSTLNMLVQDGILTLAEAAKRANMSVEAFTKAVAML